MTMGCTLLKFEIHCGDGGNQKFTGETINTCHQILMEAVNKAREGPQKVRSWCAEDTRIDYNALQRSREGFQRRLEFEGPGTRLTFNTMADSDKLRVFLNQTNASQLQPLASSMSSLDDLSTNDGDADNSDHIDVT
ncbi:hypothetical protein HOLleu_26368 [Holothuria leucospilota]|uniref:Uncharacterized protein n=1 Tax=Holothuria leucospilota TaxID=206669 RepID=A0A9Q1H1X3_HOLLE|nr:hypothetical protein HOLleu_26368 [Holothuria leucospilota]